MHPPSLPYPRTVPTGRLQQRNRPRTGAKRATPILARRVKQAISEWYVVNMLELSWDGLVTHTEHGYNIGKPPNGYQVEAHRHPVPAKAADGLVKRRLVPDPARAATVTQIFTWRAVEKLSFAKIAERLNLDPDRYPPRQPIPVRGRQATGRWTGGAVREVLSNPKYTGYMVYNRRKRARPERRVAGKVNLPSEWVWSSKPTHEPLTTRRLFEAASPVGKSNRGSRSGAGANRHPATKRTYRLRSYIICELCGRRLYGKTRYVGDVYSYYACEPNPAHHAHRDWYPTHPKSLWVREDKLLTAVHAFFARRIFGQHRDALLAQREQPTLSDNPSVARRAALKTKIREIERQQTNVVTELQTYHPTGDDDLDQQWRTQLRASFAELGNQRKTLQAQLAALAEQPTDSPSDPRLLDQLPVTDVDVAALPEDLQRDLFDSFQLQIRYHHPTRRLTLRGHRQRRHQSSTPLAERRRPPGTPGRPGTPGPVIRAAATSTDDRRRCGGLSLALCAPNPTQYEPSTRGLVIAAQACRLDVGCVVSGSRMANREPTPGVLVTVMWPVCWVMIHNAMARPSPVPVVAAALRPR